MRFLLTSTTWELKLDKYKEILKNFNTNTNVQLNHRNELFEYITLEINSIEELKNFIDKINEEIVISNDNFWINEKIPMIEIYDTYRE